MSGDSRVFFSGAASFIPELWALDVLEETECGLVVANLVTRFDDVAGDAYHSGLRRVFVPRPGDSALVPMEFVTKDFCVDIDDVVSIQAKSSLRSVYTKNLGQAIANFIDGNLLACAVEAISKGAGAKGGEPALRVMAGGPLGVEHVIGASYCLDDYKAPTQERFLVVGPEGRRDLVAEFRAIGDVLGRMQATPGDGAEAPPTGFVAHILGNGAYVSPNVVAEIVEAAGEPGRFHNLMFQRGALGLGVAFGPAISASHDEERNVVVVTARIVFGCAMLNQAWAVDVVAS